MTVEEFVKKLSAGFGTKDKRLDLVIHWIVGITGLLILFTVPNAHWAAMLPFATFWPSVFRRLMDTAFAGILLPAFKLVSHLSAGQQQNNNNLYEAVSKWLKNVSWIFTLVFSILTSYLFGFAVTKDFLELIANIVNGYCSLGWVTLTALLAIVTVGLNLYVAISVTSMIIQDNFDFEPRLIVIIIVLIATSIIRSLLELIALDISFTTIVFRVILFASIYGLFAASGRAVRLARENQTTNPH